MTGRPTAAEQLELFDGHEYARTEPTADCLDCGANTVEAAEYYMVTDEVWLEANPADDGMLCIGCLEQRIGRRLQPDDFTGVPISDRGWQSPRLRARLLGLEEAMLAA